MFAGRFLFAFPSQVERAHRLYGEKGPGARGDAIAVQ